MSNIYTWYRVVECKKLFGIINVRNTVYKSTHADQIALWMVEKPWNDYKIYKRDEEVLFPPTFVITPKHLTVIKMAEFADYLRNWENNPEIYDENPTGV